MRASVGIAIPLDATSGQLRALASLFATMERARWESLARTFDRMDRDAAQLAEPLETMLGRLAGELRRAAKEREPVVEDGHDQAVVNVATKGRL